MKSKTSSPGHKAIEKIANEYDLTDRGLRVADIAELKKRDKELGTFALICIWLDLLEAAGRMLNNGLLIGQRYIRRVQKCEIKRNGSSDAKDSAI
ncbi:Pc12g02340 [Penicillium rubens Wisconsin 54-1255]|uniref:Pc12g02340 protein n=1 Tax=Penicillium rubens (strain ATCC 28089 / DSM 1075 / NRRL 1951 / Wisconsin 54-1255) TaxID=500485 RepID=B6GZV7_PENRW|nr:Pc12g02340 [Penicillium rubens Wisconsin 54-1255]